MKSTKEMDELEFAVWRVNKLEEKYAAVRYYDPDMETVYLTRIGMLLDKIEKRYPGRVGYDVISDCWCMKSREEV